VRRKAEIRDEVERVAAVITPVAAHRPIAPRAYALGALRALTWALGREADPPSRWLARAMFDTSARRQAHGDR
jgi:hypothetical protein